MVSREITLTEPHVGFFSRYKQFLRSAILKAKGLVDLRENVIYLDTTALPQRKSFVKLHEVGHKVLPWQRDSYVYLDDQTTLDPDVKELFEREANHFASDVLFQVDRFDREARDLPLDIKSALHLYKRYGASIHATLRRFVRQNHRACALLVIEREVVADSGEVRLHVRSVDESRRFGRLLGRVTWPEYLGPDCPATPLIWAHRKVYDDGRLTFRYPDGSTTECCFQLFDNSYNSFIFVYPADEQARTRTRFVVTR